MKKILLIYFFFAAFAAVNAQRMPSVGVAPVEAAGRVTPDEAANITRRVITELSSWGTLNVLSGVDSADYIVRGKLSRQGDAYVLAAETMEAKTGKVLNESREQIASLGDFPVFSFCAKVVDRVPLPNYLLGTWQATISMPNGPIVCIMEFKSDRTVRVEKYDTWESRQKNALKYEGYGAGTYSYVGYARRTVPVRDASGATKQVRIDAAANVNLQLEDTLPDQNDVSRTGLFLLFNEAKNNFEIIDGSLPCGRNYDGPSVYPSEYVGFTQFRKLR